MSATVNFAKLWYWHSRQASRNSSAKTRGLAKTLSLSRQMGPAHLVEPKVTIRMLKDPTQIRITGLCGRETRTRGLMEGATEVAMDYHWQGV